MMFEGSGGSEGLLGPFLTVFVSGELHQPAPARCKGANDMASRARKHERGAHCGHFGALRAQAGFKGGLEMRPRPKRGLLGTVPTQRAPIPRFGPKRASSSLHATCLIPDNSVPPRPSGLVARPARQLLAFLAL